MVCGALVSCTRIDQSCYSSEGDLSWEGITKSCDVEYLYHENTGLLLQSQEDPYRTLDNTKATHMAVEFLPKNLEEYLFLTELSSEGVTTSLIPFGYAPVRNASESDLNNYRAYSGGIKYHIQYRSLSNDQHKEESCFSREESHVSPLPIVYALWPVNKKLPQEIDHEIRYMVSIPKRIEDPVQQIILPLKIDTQDSFLASFVPMGMIKVRLSRGSFTADFYTTASGSLNIRPLMLNTPLTLSEIEQMNVSVVFQSEFYTVSRNDNITPIQKSLGTVYSLWGSMNYGTYPTYTSHLTSTTNECEVYRAANYYYCGSHAFSSLKLSSESGRIIHSSSITSGLASTFLYSNDVPTIYVYNNPDYAADNNCIGSVIHELGHVHHYYRRGGYNQFNQVSDLLQESFASYVGWSVGEQYYISKGYVIPYGEHLNWQHRQDWIPHSGDNYSPLFVDLTDDYNQSILIDAISGVPASIVDDMGAQCTSILQCKTHMSNYIGLYLTTTQLNTYFSYYL